MAQTIALCPNLTHCLAKPLMRVPPQYDSYDNLPDEYDPYAGLPAAGGYQAQEPSYAPPPEQEWEVAWAYEEAAEQYGVEDGYGYVNAPATAVQPDLILFGGVALILFLLLLGVFRWLGPAQTITITTEVPVVPTAVVSAPPFDHTTLVFPYDDYILTQGPHGFSYGHMAIDISAGNGATIKSPIMGSVTQYYFDGLGNSILVIENDKYQVTMLHGVYTVQVGDQLKPGDKVGTESNLGNTYDWAGNSCRNRDCGYHTHLNIFDKEFGQNVNPLDLFYGN